MKNLNMRRLFAGLGYQELLDSSQDVRGISVGECLTLPVSMGKKNFLYPYPYQMLWGRFSSYFRSHAKNNFRGVLHKQFSSY